MPGQIDVRLHLEGGSSGINTSRGKINSEGDLYRLGEVLAKFADRIEAAMGNASKGSKGAAKGSLGTLEAKISELNKTLEALVKNGARQFGPGTSTNADHAFKASLDRQLFKMRADHQMSMLEVRRTMQKEHADLWARNSLISGGAGSAFAFAMAIKGVAASMGQSDAQLLLSNALNRPDQAVGSYYSQRINAAGSAYGTAAQGIGAGLGFAVGSIPGAFIGAGIGTILDAIGSYFTPQIAANQQLDVTSQYFGGVARSVYGSQFRLNNPTDTFNQGFGVPGGIQAGDLMQVLSGKVFGNNAFTTAAYGSLFASYLGGQPGQASQIAGSIGQIAQLQGKGGSAQDIGEQLIELITLQEKYGGDMSESLKMIAELLKSSNVKGFQNIASMVYHNNLLGQGVGQAAALYANQGQQSQFVSSMLVRAMTGADLNTAMGIGADGKPVSPQRQIAELLKIQRAIKGGGPTGPAGVNPLNWVLQSTSLGVGGTNAILNAPLSNIKLPGNLDAARTAELQKAMQDLMSNNMAGFSKDITPLLDPITDQARQPAQQRAQSVQLHAQTVIVNTNNANSPTRDAAFIASGGRM